MNFAIGYCLYRVGYELVVCTKRWYGEGLKVVFRSLIATLEKLDRVFALEITAKNLFEPLYQDRTIVGYILGFVMRIGRIVVAIAIYGVVIIVGSAMCFVWLAVPLFVVYQIIKNYELAGNLL